MNYILNSLRNVVYATALLAFASTSALAQEVDQRHASKPDL